LAKPPASRCHPEKSFKTSATDHSGHPSTVEISSEHSTGFIVSSCQQNRDAFVIVDAPDHATIVVTSLAINASGADCSPYCPNSRLSRLAGRALVIAQRTQTWSSLHGAGRPA
jgi:hypothetical protein